MIFAKFDEVQNSGGMILGISKGKNKLSQFSKTFLKLFSKALETKTKTFSNRLLYRWFSRLDFAAWNLGYNNTFTYCWSLPIFFSLIMDQLYKMILFLCLIFLYIVGFICYDHLAFYVPYMKCVFYFQSHCFTWLFLVEIVGLMFSVTPLCRLSDIAGVETQA